MQSRQRPHPNEFCHHFQREQNCDNGKRGPKRRQRDVKSSFDEIEWCKYRECDAAHAVHEGFIAQKNSRQDQPNQIGGQHGLTFRRGGEAAEEKQNKQNEFHFRLAHSRRAQPLDGSSLHRLPPPMWWTVRSLRSAPAAEASPEQIARTTKRRRTARRRT